MTTAEEISLLYRSILGRAPDQTHLEACVRSGRSFEELRRDLLTSEEYLLMNAQMSVTGETHYLTNLTKRNDQKLALGCIVKNEASNVATMLRSCASIINYAVIIDTGSGDETVNISRNTLDSLGVPYIIDSIIFEDFATARNEVIDRIPGEMNWVLMLDADEHLVSEDFPLFRDLLYAGQNIDAWQIPRYNFVDKEKANPVVSYPDYQRRLFRNTHVKPIRYIGRVHEALANVQGWGFAPVSDLRGIGNQGGPHIHHMGLVDIEFDRQHAKQQLYARLGGLIV